MGAVLAKRDQERQEFNLARARASEYLEKCRPEYIEDDALLGLAPEGDEPTDGEDHADGASTVDNSSVKDGSEASSEGSSKKKEAAEGFDPRARIREKVKREKAHLLHAATHGRKWSVLKVARKPHVQVDHGDSYGRTALFLAAEKGHCSVINVLLTLRAKVDKSNRQGWTPLHAATFHGQVKCIEELMLAMANVNARDRHGCTPLMFAASSPKLYLLDLVSKGDRKRRQKVRKMDASQATHQQAPRSSLIAFNPDEIWKHHPTRIELIVMERLFSTGRVTVDILDKRRRTPLIYAARYGRMFAVSRLLHAKANLKFADHDGRTALFHAAANEHVETVEMLLRAGGSVNSTDQFFRTPLHAALETGDEGMSNLLLKAEASVNAYDCEGRTPIMLAMEANNRRLFAAVIERRSNLDVLDKRGWNVVMYSIETGMVSEVLPLLFKLGDGVKLILRARDPQGKNSLHHATQLPDVNAANKALNSLVKLDPEAAAVGDCNGDTAIHFAAEAGRLEALRMLIEKLPAADYVNNRGETPLHHAAHGGQLACVVALVHDRGKGPACDAGVLDSDGKNLLIHACVSGHLDLVNLLLANRMGKHPDLALPPLDVNHSDHSGVNALMLAAREGHWQLMASLCLAGANLQAQDDDGFTALHWAVMEDESLAVSSLLDLGMPCDPRDRKGWTPLMHGAARGSDEALRVLVDMGADLDVRNFDGDTAFQICMRRRDHATKVQVSKDILADAMFNLSQRPKASIVADGHFMVSVLSAEDLYLEGKVGEVNAYVLLQVCTQNGMNPEVAFTSCTLKDPNPEWHEVFRFDSERLDPSSYLIAWVFAAPGENAEEVVKGTALGLSEDELNQLTIQEEITGKKTHYKANFATAIQDSFDKVMKRADKAQEQEVTRLRKKELAESRDSAPTMDLMASSEKERTSVPLEERRWTQVSNLRALLRQLGSEVQEPLVPRCHLPLGCVVMRFRQLRAAVWGTDPVEINRTLRLGCRGSLRLQVDFRPRFFKAKADPHAQMLSRAEEDEIYTVKPISITAETVALDDSFAPRVPVGLDEERRVVSFADELRRHARFAQLRDPEVLFKRFMQVTVWSRKVLEARSKLAPELEVLPTRGSTRGSTEDEPYVVREAKRLVARYKAARAHQLMRRDVLDRPIGVVQTAPPSRPGTAQRGVQPGAKGAAAPAPAPPKLPKLKAEPWVEDLLERSRFF